MIAALLSLISPLVAIGREIAAAERAKAVAQTDSERIAADERIARLQAQRDVLVAEQGSWFTRGPRAIMGWAAALYVAKLLVWDKVLGWGVTDPVAGDLRDWMLVIIGGYFLTELRPFRR